MTMRRRLAESAADGQREAEPGPRKAGPGANRHDAEVGADDPLEARPGVNDGPVAERVARGSSRMQALLVVALGAALVGFAILGRTGPAGATIAPTEPVGVLAASPAAPTPLREATPPGLAAPFTPTRPLPAALDCGGVPMSRCEAMTTAALAQLPGEDPVVSAASVSDSLLCNSNFDCPPDVLKVSRPLGSVVISFVDGGPAAWFNVIQSPTGRDAVVDAWLVRWAATAGSAATPAHCEVSLVTGSWTFSRLALERADQAAVC